MKNEGSIDKLLRAMCHEALSGADVKAICKSRGFSGQEAKSRALFENFFLSSSGVEAALSMLSEEEKMLLYGLNFTGDTVGIAFFARIYAKEDSGYYGTFTQRFQDTFKAVKKNLVRKGVLLMAEAGRGDTKMERWRFRFPPQFAAYLPPLFKETVKIEGAGSLHPDTFRDYLMKHTKERLAIVTSNLALLGGQLLFRGRPFRAKHVQVWQQAGWEAAVQQAYSERVRAARGSQIQPWSLDRYSSAAEGAIAALMPFLTYAFSQLKAGEWIRQAALTPLLGVFYRDAQRLTAEEICVAGWKWRCLASVVVEGETFYRLNDPRQEEVNAVDPGDYIQVDSKKAVLVKLRTIPYKSLEVLAQIADLESAGTRLKAVPSLIKLGEVPDTVRTHEVTQWLNKHSAAFNTALAEAKKRWGRVVVHENLLLARVTELSLRVSLEKAFTNGEIVFLPNDWLAFPYRLAGKVEGVVRKAGHVVKTVAAE